MQATMKPASSPSVTLAAFICGLPATAFALVYLPFGIYVLAETLSGASQIDSETINFQLINGLLILAPMFALPQYWLLVFQTHRQKIYRQGTNFHLAVICTFSLLCLFGFILPPLLLVALPTLASTVWLLRIQKGFARNNSIKIYP